MTKINLIKPLIMIKNKFLIFFSLTLAMFTLLSCEEDNSTSNPLSNFVGIEANKNVFVELDGVVDVEAKVIASEAVNADRTFELVVDAVSTHNPSYYSVPATVTIPSGSKEAVFTVNVTGTDLGSGKTIVIGLKPVVDVNMALTSATNLTYQKLTLNVREVCNDNPLTIEIVTDAYGSETTWELYSASDLDNPIATGGPYADQSAAGAYAQTPVITCLVDGDYIFVIYDQYSDGMNSGYGEGYYRLTKTNPLTGEATVIAQNGVFGQFDVVQFSLP